MKEEITEETVSQILPHFSIQGTPTKIVRNTQGHINDSFKVTTDKTNYFVQRISPIAFKEPVKVMENIDLVTQHLSKKIRAEGGNPAEECLNIIPAKDGKPYFLDEFGHCWRVYLFLDGKALDAPRNLHDFEEAGYAFGRFQYLLSDFDPSKLFEVIPHFHDTPKRYRDLEAAIARDKMGRVKECEEEIAFCRARKNNLSKVTDGLENGTLPLRITHNDTKLNNVMFDLTSGKATAVIDLDTVMPGSPLYDFGDAIRFGANRGKEDEKDLANVSFDIERFKAYLRGFLRGAKGAFTKEEISLFGYASALMTFECGSRFLADYLDGDVYFHIAYPEHNLVRARDQFALVKSIEDSEADINEALAPYLK